MCQSGLLYILKNRVPVKVHDQYSWGVWFMTSDDRIVAKTMIDDIEVSTVFLGLDHNLFGRGDPVLFETMVFLPDGDNGMMNRYCTWDAATAGHHDIVRRVQVERETAGLIVGDTLSAIMVDLREKH